MDHDRAIPIVSYAVGGGRSAKAAGGGKGSGARALRYRASAVAVTSVLAIATLYYSWPTAIPYGDSDGAERPAQAKRSSAEGVAPGFSVTRGPGGSFEAEAAETEVGTVIQAVGNIGQIEEHSRLPLMGVVKVDSSRILDSSRVASAPLASMVNIPASDSAAALTLHRGETEEATGGEDSLGCELACDEVGAAVSNTVNTMRTFDTALAAPARPGVSSIVNGETETGVAEIVPPALFADAVSSQLVVDAVPPFGDLSEDPSLPSVEAELAAERNEGKLPIANSTGVEPGAMVHVEPEGLSFDDDPVLPVDSGSEVREVIAEHLERIEYRYSEAPQPEHAADEPKGPSADQLAGLDGADDLGVVVPLDEDVGFSGVVLEDELVAIRLNDLVSLFEDRIERPLYVWLRSSSSGSNYVTSETLEAAGIDAKYDPQKKQIVFSLVDDKR